MWQRSIGRRRVGAWHLGFAGHLDILEDDGMASGGAHAERVPGRLDARAAAAEWLRYDQRQEPGASQLGQALDGKGRVTVVSRGVLGGHLGSRARLFDNMLLAFGAGGERSRVAHPGAATASCSRTA